MASTTYLSPSSGSEDSGSRPASATRKVSPTDTNITTPPVEITVERVRLRYALERQKDGVGSYATLNEFCQKRVITQLQYKDLGFSNDSWEATVSLHSAALGIIVGQGSGR